MFASEVWQRSLECAAQVDMTEVLRYIDRHASRGHSECRFYRCSNNLTEAHITRMRALGYRVVPFYFSNKWNGTPYISVEMDPVFYTVSWYPEAK